jgi:hypothetical protein
VGMASRVSCDIGNITDFVENILIFTAEDNELMKEDIF